MDAPIKVFEPWIRTFMFQTRKRFVRYHINAQFGKYAAFIPDPRKMYIDAFSINWFRLMFCAFPSISVIPRVLSKVKQDSKIVPRVL